MTHFNVYGQNFQSATTVTDDSLWLALTWGLTILQPIVIASMTGTPIYYLYTV